MWRIQYKISIFYSYSDFQSHAKLQHGYPDKRNQKSYNNLFATLLHMLFPIHYLCRMNFRINWDALGILTSIACAIHCAILPLVLGSLPVFGVNIIDNPAFEFYMILLAFAIGFYALWHGYRKHHRNLTPPVIFIAGILLLFSKQIWHQYQSWILPFAITLVVTAHMLNYRLCRVHNHSRASDCAH